MYELELEDDSSLPGLTDKTLKELCQVFGLLADEPRLRILLYLSRTGEWNVTELCERLQQSQPAVSHHLKLMRLAGVVQVRREGKHNYYSLRAEPFRQLMNVLTHEKATLKPCDCFLECVLSG